jgi:hypothetical protein
LRLGLVYLPDDRLRWPSQFAAGIDANRPIQGKLALQNAFSPGPLVSAFENGRAGQDRPQWAQISRDLSWSKAEWQLSKKRKRTFDSHECRTAKFDSSRGVREALSRRIAARL